MIQVYIYCEDFNNKNLSIFLKKLQNLLIELNIVTNYIIRLPILSTKFVTIKSPHIYKKSRHKFEIRKYKHFIKIEGLNQKVLEKILNYIGQNINFGIVVKFKIIKEFKYYEKNLFCK